MERFDLYELRLRKLNKENVKLKAENEQLKADNLQLSEENVKLKADYSVTKKKKVE